MKTYIYILRYPKDLTFHAYEQYVSLVSSERAEKIKRFIFDGDKLNSLFSELLLRQIVLKKIGICDSDISFGYSEYGKPFFKNIDLKFSVSHTKNCVAVAVSENEVGVDIERISQYYEDISINYFCRDEYQYIAASPDKSAAFYEIWTMKEAYLKMTGTGLLVPLSSFSVFETRFRNNCVKLRKADLVMAVYSEYALDEESVSIHYVNVSDLSLDGSCPAFEV